MDPEPTSPALRAARRPQRCSARARPAWEADLLGPTEKGAAALRVAAGAIHTSLPRFHCRRCAASAERGHDAECIRHRHSADVVPGRTGTRRRRAAEAVAAPRRWAQRSEPRRGASPIERRQGHGRRRHNAAGPVSIPSRRHARRCHGGRPDMPGTTTPTPRRRSGARDGLITIESPLAVGASRSGAAGPQVHGFRRAASRRRPAWSTRRWCSTAR
jgi:hypothetical protein